MAEVVDESIFKGRRQYHSIYPWESWLDGQAWELVQGTDFYISTGSFQRAAAGAARDRGLGIRTRTRNLDIVIIQALPPR